jgi:hypothetical protein
MAALSRPAIVGNFCRLDNVVVILVPTNRFAGNEAFSFPAGHAGIICGK